MTIRHLQIFKAVAEAGKMGQAARQLYISQPTVSKAIGDLEKEYGVLLFDRLAQKLYITEAGTRLLRYARQLLALYDEMEADLHAAAGLQAIREGSRRAGSCWRFPLSGMSWCSSAARRILWPGERPCRPPP